MERKAIAQKKKEVDRLTEKLEKAISFYIVDYTGLDANAMNNLRGKFRSSNFDYFVIKNSILERASERLGFDEIKEVLAGPNSISISYDDPIGPVRIINDHYKETELPTVKLCFIEGKWLSAKEVNRLADLPSREVLVGQVLNLMVSPMSRLVGLLSNLLSGFIRVVDGVRDQRQQEQPAAQGTEEAVQEEENVQEKEVRHEEEKPVQDKEAEEQDPEKESKATEEDNKKDEAAGEKSEEQKK